MARVFSPIISRDPRIITDLQCLFRCCATGHIGFCQLDGPKAGVVSFIDKDTTTTLFIPSETGERLSLKTNQGISCRLPKAFRKDFLGTNTRGARADLLGGRRIGGRGFCPAGRNLSVKVASMYVSIANESGTTFIWEVLYTIFNAITAIGLYYSLKAP
jgi:hypothetical protein